MMIDLKRINEMVDELSTTYKILKAGSLDTMSISALVDAEKLLSAFDEAPDVKAIMDKLVDDYTLKDLTLDEVLQLNDFMLTTYAKNERGLAETYAQKCVKDYGEGDYTEFNFLKQDHEEAYKVVADMATIGLPFEFLKSDDILALASAAKARKVFM